MDRIKIGTLYSLDPDLARSVVDTDNDPFYADDRLPRFLDWLFVKLTQK